MMMRGIVGRTVRWRVDVVDDDDIDERTCSGEVVACERDDGEFVLLVQVKGDMPSRPEKLVVRLASDVEVLP